MIRQKLLWWLVMFVLLVTAVWLVSSNEGYVLIIRNPYRIQISFNFFLIAVVGLFLGLHYCLKIIDYLRGIPVNKKNKQNILSLKAGNVALLEGMHALAEGDVDQAKRSANLAQSLIKNADLEILIQKLENHHTGQH
ncbi:MAG: heme biosynthesis HemY N-terminal domain-containing protein [Methylotenera sp.]|nr:heme biosynthesis HemY N-terminal domain-containing protein [Methylotenera sp.]